VNKIHTISNPPRHTRINLQCEALRIPRTDGTCQEWFCHGDIFSISTFSNDLGDPVWIGKKTGARFFIACPWFFITVEIGPNYFLCSIAKVFMSQFIGFCRVEKFINLSSSKFLLFPFPTVAFSVLLWLLIFSFQQENIADTTKENLSLDLHIIQKSCKLYRLVRSPRLLKKSAFQQDVGGIILETWLPNQKQ